MRGRKADLNGILTTVERVLTRYPYGLPLRELSRRTGIPASTLAYHLARGLAPYVEETRIRPASTTIVRLIVWRGVHDAE